MVQTWLGETTTYINILKFLPHGGQFLLVLCVFFGEVFFLLGSLGHSLNSRFMSPFIQARRINVRMLIILIIRNLKK